MNTYIMKGKAIIMTSVAFMLLAVGLEVYTNLGNIKFADLAFHYDNTVDITEAVVDVKNNPNTILDSVFNKKLYTGLLTETAMKPVEQESKASKIITNEDIWHFPTRIGEVSQYPHYNHIAYDITSPRGAMEDIYPVADGVVSGIFSDSAGALIVTISHNIDGNYYTSEYVHLSSYAQELYVGKNVTINDSIGKMGQTGIAYGNHLHFTLLDCNLFNDTNCSDINSFYNYGKQRFNEGFIGLGSLINVPSSWNY